MNEGRIKLGKKNKRTGRWGISFLTKGHLAAIERGELVVEGKDKNGTLIVKNAENSRIAQKGKTIWTNVAYSATEYGSTLLRKIIPKRRFPFPKSLYSVEEALRYYLINKPDAIVLDYFAGSGTTAHAVMRLNKQDNGKRVCISITNNEIAPEEEKKFIKKGLRKGDSEWEATGICEYITKPRITSIITGKTPDGEPIQGNYKFIDEFPMSDGFNENVVFFDLTYENPILVNLGMAYHDIAPLLWMKAGCRGEIIEEESKSYAIADNYAVLFDYAYVKEFERAVEANTVIGTLYVVTDDDGRLARVKAMFPGRDVIRLYEAYLRSFKIASEGAMS